MTDRPTTSWEGRSAHELAERWDIPSIHLFESLGSTSTVARDLASSGAADGTVVLAERQTAGRGRAGRVWASPSGLGLWFSVVHRPLDVAPRLPLPLRVGLAVARALDPFLAPLPVRLKWPNDVVVDAGKIGGILCEGSWAGGVGGPVIVGVGLNLLHGEEELDPAIRTTATSVRIASGRAPSRLAVADAVVPAVARACERSATGVPPAAELRDRDALAGLSVTVTEPATGRVLAHGIAAGIGDGGGLRVRLADGTLRVVESGTVRIAGPDLRAPLESR